MLRIVWAYQHSQFDARMLQQSLWLLVVFEAMSKPPQVTAASHQPGCHATAAVKPARLVALPAITIIMFSHSP
jgi:hypothetical protein